MAPQDIYYHNRLGYTYHLRRRLQEASEEYMRVLELDPPQLPTHEDTVVAIKYAPRLFITPYGPFGLRDVVVVLHPLTPLIGYHLFWGDDIDYPDDNDPVDHEVVWVEYDPHTGQTTGVYTYFHRAVLTTKEAIEEARAHAQKARINVQWGGHGSLPVGWGNIPPEEFVVKYDKIKEAVRIKDMKTRYEKHRNSIRKPNHPLARTWPQKFVGTWKQYVDFSRPIDLEKMIKEKKMIIKSRWANAVIDQYFLHYQFYPKLEWPKELP